MRLIHFIAFTTVCLLLAEARRGGGGSRGGSRGSSGSRSRPSSTSSRDRDSGHKPYPVQPKPPSHPSAPSAPSAPGWNVGGSNSPPAPGWNIGGQPKNPGTNGLMNPPTNPHWNPSSGSSGFPQSKPPAPGWNVGGNAPPAPGWNVGHNNPSPGFGTNTFQQPGSQPGWNTGGGYRPAGGYGGFGNNYGGSYGGYGQQQQHNFPTYGAPPSGWNNPVGNFNFGNRMAGGYGSAGYGSVSKGSSKTGLLAAAGAGAATVAGVYFLSQALSPGHRGYDPYYHGSGWGSRNPTVSGGSGSGSNNGPNNQPPMPQMICVGGSNNCTYQPVAVQCVNATFNGSDGQMQWQIACGDPKMSHDLCFSRVNLTCSNATVLNMNGTTSNVTTQLCKLEYAIDHVKDSNCTASLTFPEKYVSNSATKSGSGGKMWALLIIPIGLAIIGGICWMTGCGSNSGGGKNIPVQSHDEASFSPDVSGPSYGSNQPYPSAMSYQSNAPPYPSGAPYPEMPMPTYPTGPSAPYPSANAPPYMQSNFSGYPTGAHQPPYPSAPY